MRKEVNKLDNLTTGKAIDALLNFETVALFNNQVCRSKPQLPCSRLSVVIIAQTAVSQATGRPEQQALWQARMPHSCPPLARLNSALMFAPGPGFELSEQH